MKILITSEPNPYFDTWLSIKNPVLKLIVTPQSLMDKGMYACSCCGKLNNLEAEKCINCNEEKFIITQ